MVERAVGMSLDRGQGRKADMLTHLFIYIYVHTYAHIQTYGHMLKTKSLNLLGNHQKTFSRKIMWPDLHFIKSRRIFMGR